MKNDPDKTNHSNSRHYMSPIKFVKHFITRVMSGKNESRLRTVSRKDSAQFFSRHITAVSIIVFILICLVFIQIWRLGEKRRLNDLKLKTSLTTQQVALRLKDHILSYLAVINFLKSEWKEGEITDSLRFCRQALDIQSAYPGFQAINFIDTLGIIRWVVPESSNLPAKGKDLHTHPDAAETFVYSETHKVERMTPPVNLWQGGKGFTIYSPLIYNGHLKGYLNSVFRIKHFLDQALNKGIDRNFALQLFDENELFYSIGKTEENLYRKLHNDYKIQILNREWTVCLAPTKGLVDSVSSPLEEIALSLGIILAGIIAMLVRGQLLRQKDLYFSLNLLRESEEKYRAFIDNFQGIAYLRFPDREQPLIFQGAVEKITGYRSEDFTNGSVKWKNLIHPDDRSKHEDFCKDITLLKRSSSRITYRIIDKSGQLHWIEEVCSTARDFDNNSVHIYGSLYDTTEITLTQIALRESEEKHRSIIENSLMGIFMIQDKRIVFCNRRFAELFGFSSEDEVIGAEFQALISDESLSDIQKLFGSAQKEISYTTPTLLKARRKDGSEFDVETLGNWIIYQNKPTFQGMLLDISEKLRLEKQIQQSQRLESIGMLASGIAHDFNNVLTAIIGSAEMALFDLKSDHLARENLNEIIKSVHQAANLTRQLLVFSSKQPINPEVVGVNDIVRNLNKMLSRLIGEDIQLVLDLSESVGCIKADPGQVEQILVNLVVNARDAIKALPQDYGVKRITISTHLETLDKKFIEHYQDCPPGEYVRITVADTGVGIKSENLNHIFDPFFTTKDANHGTGLGLSTIYGIVRQNNGIITVESTPMKGAQFHIFWRSEPNAVIPAAKKPEKDTRLFGTETILLVEDDNSIREVYAKILKKHGYTVYSASNGKKALEIISEHGKDINLLFTDIVMPEIDGNELAVEAKLYYPDLKILFSSGFSEQMHLLKEDKSLHFIQKPYNQKELLKKIREVLDL